MEHNLTITQIALEIDIPESTARRYAKQLSYFLPSNQIGRTVKYTPIAITVLRDASTLFTKGHTADKVKEILAEKYEQIITGDIVEDDESSRDNLLPADVTLFKDLVAETIRNEIAASQERSHQQIVKLSEEVKQLREELAKSQDNQAQHITRLTRERDEQVLTKLRDIHDKLQQKEGFFSRLFGKKK